MAKKKTIKRHDTKGMTPNEIARVRAMEDAGGDPSALRKGGEFRNTSDGRGLFTVPDSFVAPDLTALLGLHAPTIKRRNTDKVIAGAWDTAKQMAMPWRYNGLTPHNQQSKPNVVFNEQGVPFISYYDIQTGKTAYDPVDFASGFIPNRNAFLVSDGKGGYDISQHDPGTARWQQGKEVGNTGGVPGTFLQPNGRPAPVQAWAEPGLLAKLQGKPNAYLGATSDRATAPMGRNAPDEMRAAFTNRHDLFATTRAQAHAAQDSLNYRDKVNQQQQYIAASIRNNPTQNGPRLGQAMNNIQQAAAAIRPAPHPAATIGRQVKGVSGRIAQNTGANTVHSIIDDILRKMRNR